jgi:hypothetical protein
MLTFVRSATARDVGMLHPTLWKILREIVDVLWLEHTGQSNVYVTELWRPREETIRLYQSAGLAPPAFSVHETAKVLGDPWSGCRGADLSVRTTRAGQRYEDWPRLPVPVCREVVAAINRRWRYQESEAHQVALYHSVTGPHVHLQVRPDQETVDRLTIGGG